jgi:hypothetical protein
MLHSMCSRRISLRRGLSEPHHRMCNVSIHTTSPVVVAHSDVPLRTRVTNHRDSGGFNGSFFVKLNKNAHDDEAVVGLCTLNLFDSYPITYSLSNL